MKAARNMKELEEMIIGDVKEKLIVLTKEYCNKWYEENDVLKEIMSETEFANMVKDSLKISMTNVELNSELELFKDIKIEDEKRAQLDELWKKFKLGYIDYAKKRICNQ